MLYANKTGPPSLVFLILQIPVGYTVKYLLEYEVSISIALFGAYDVLEAIAP